MNSLASKSGLALGIMLLGGCADQSVRVYTTPKEEPIEVAAGGGQHDHGHEHQGSQAPQAHVHWELPAGWKEEKPDRLRVASFTVRGESGKLAEVAVIPLPGVSGIELDSVNIWRQELGLEPLKPEEFSEQAKEIAVGGGKGHQVEFVANENRPGKDFKNRTLGVVLPREKTLWFIKMTGEDELVAAQRDKFNAFVQSLELHASAADHGPKSATVSANTDQLPATAGLPKWQPPANWQAKAPGSMVTAAYSVSSGDGRAEITISKLGANFGGLLPNVQRWQRQLGTEAATAENLEKVVSSVEIDGKKFSMVDLSGTDLNSSEPARTLVVIIPGSGETWFYKMMGHPATVGAEKDNLIKFIEEAH